MAQMEHCTIAAASIFVILVINNKFLKCLMIRLMVVSWPILDDVLCRGVPEVFNLAGLGLTYKHRSFQVPYV